MNGAARCTSLVHKHNARQMDMGLSRLLVLILCIRLRVREAATIDPEESLQVMTLSLS